MAVLDMREVEVYYDVAGDRLLNSDGEQLRKEDYPRIHYAEQILFLLHLVDGDVSTPFTGFKGDTYTAVIETDWNHSTTVMVKALNSAVNVSGDWSLASPANGRFSVRLNAHTTQYLAAVDGKEEDTNTKLELKGISSAGKLASVVQLYFRSFNLLEWDGDLPEEVPSTMTLTQITVGTAIVEQITMTDSEDLRFNVFADPQWAQGEFQTTISACKTYSHLGEFVFIAGDLPPASTLLGVAATTVEASRAVFPCVGNHDLEDPADVAYIRAWVQNNCKTFTGVANWSNGPSAGSDAGTRQYTTYSFDWDHVHFVVLDQYASQGAGGDYDSDIDDALYNWLREDLQSTDKGAIIVIGHEPPFPAYRHVGNSLDEHARNRDRFWNLLETHHVSAAFFGHIHYWKAHQPNLNGTWQFMVPPSQVVSTYGQALKGYLTVTMSGRELVVQEYSVLYGVSTLESTTTHDISNDYKSEHMSRLHQLPRQSGNVRTDRDERWDEDKILHAGKFAAGPVGDSRTNEGIPMAETYHATKGDNRRGMYHRIKETTDGVMTRIGDGDLDLTVPDNTTWKMVIHVAALSRTKKAAGWTIEGQVIHDSLSCQWVDDPIPAVADNPLGATEGHEANISDDSNGVWLIKILPEEDGLKLSVKGEAGETIRWLWWVEAYEVSLPVVSSGSGS